MTLYGVSLRRLVQLIAVLARHALAVALGPRLTQGSFLARRLPAGEMAEPERLRALFEDLGGSFLKLGQMLALQPDILPREYCDALFNLLDRVPPFSFEEVEKVFAEEIGHGPAELFETFEPRPIASASIGQVHVAHLGGRKVAVKVQRPTAERDFGGDLRLMELSILLIRRLRIRRLMFLLEPISELIEWTVEELDYLCEARFMEELGRGSRGRPHQRVPEVFRALTTRRILVMEFLDGVTVLDYLRAVDSGDEVTRRRLSREGFDAELFVSHIIDNFLHQAFVRGLFHADLHPANLMILPGNVVGYLDLGITGTLNPYSRRQLAMMTLAYTRGDVERMGTAFHRVSLADEAVAERYRKGLVELSEDWYDRAGGGVRLRKSFTLVMLEMLRLSHETGAWAQRDVIKYIRSSIATDGLITRCAPGIDLGSLLGGACARYVTGLNLGMPPSPTSVFAESAAGLRRMVASGRRAATLLEQCALGELPLKTELIRPAGAGGDARHTTVVVLTTLILALAILMNRGEMPVAVGLDLFTAQALLLTVAIGRLVVMVHAST